MKTLLARRWATAQFVLVALLVTLVVPAGFGTSDAGAQTAGNQLVGLQGESRASGIYAYYNLGGVLPIASPVDSSAPDALTTISAGPSTFARAGVYDPGDLLASPDTLAQLGGFPGYEPGTIPKYPYRIEATSGFGDSEVDSNPAPGLRGRVEAQPDHSFAQAAAGESRAPGLVGFGGVTTTTTTETDGNTVTVTARTEVSDFDLLGLLTIDSIVSEVQAVSDGADTVVSGGTEVGTAMLAGEEVTIDEDGIQPEASDDEGGQLGGALKSLSGDASELLTEAGITVTAGGVVEQDGGDIAQLAATGLQIELDITGDSAPVIGELFSLLDAVPINTEVPGAPAQIADALEIPRSRNISLLEIGRASVSLAATSAPPPPEFTVPPTDTGTGTATPTPTPSTGSTGGTTGTSPAPTTSPTTSGTGNEVVAPEPIATEPLAAFRGGLGALAVLLLLAQPLFGWALARMSRRILTPAMGVGGVCPREASHG